MVDVSVVIVNWNTHDFLDICLASIYSQATNMRYEIYVVDNGSDDCSVSMVKEKYPEVNLIVNSKNLGFAKANNQAIKFSQGRYLLMLNSDTNLFKDTISKMLEFMDAHKEAGAVGAKLLNPDCSLQHSIYNFPNLVVTFFSIFLPYNLLPFFRLSYIKYWDKHDKTKVVDYVSGACLMIRQEMIKKIGVLDEEFFMYAEEADWCFRVKKAGKKVYFFPGAQLIHYLGRSAIQRGLIRRSQELAVASIKFYNKHHNYLKASIFLALLISVFMLRMIIWQVLYFVSFGRPKKNIYDRLTLNRKTLAAILKNPMQRREVSR